jgi:AraC-like DNA-binding protein
LLAEVRARRAVDRLSKADETPIADLAYELGYSNPSNFTRAFRRQTGVSPEIFRNGIRSGSGAIAGSDGGDEE